MVPYSQVRSPEGGLPKTLYVELVHDFASNLDNAVNHRCKEMEKWLSVIALPLNHEVPGLNTIGGRIPLMTGASLHTGTQVMIFFFFFQLK